MDLLRIMLYCAGLFCAGIIFGKHTVPVDFEQSQSMVIYYVILATIISAGIIHNSIKK